MCNGLSMHAVLIPSSPVPKMALICTPSEDKQETHRNTFVHKHKAVLLGDKGEQYSPLWPYLSGRRSAVLTAPLESLRSPPCQVSHYWHPLLHKKSVCLASLAFKPAYSTIPLAQRQEINVILNLSEKQLVKGAICPCFQSWYNTDGALHSR